MTKKTIVSLGVFFLTAIPTLYAMQPQAGGDGSNKGWYGQIILFGAIFVIFFLLVIRPQQKKQKQQRELISSLQKGDQVVTGSGIYGVINKYFDDKDYVLLEIADKTVIKIQKDQITKVEKKKISNESAKEKNES